MTKNQLEIVLTSNGETLTFGHGKDLDITKVTGLESSEIDLVLQENAMLPGSKKKGARIKTRPIHIEATCRDTRRNPEIREKIIHFMNPLYTGNLYVNNMGTERQIDYEIEGWTFAEQANLDTELSVVIDLKCPNGYMKSVSDYGKNMADVVPQFAFPWISLSEQTTEIPSPYRTLGVKGMRAGYRKISKETAMENDGDVPTGVIFKIVAYRGAVSNPKVIHKESGKYIRLILDMKKGDELVIDTNKDHQVIELNGENVYQKIDKSSNTFQMEVGTNYLDYDADVDYKNLDVYVYYTPEYLGV
jgi:hypothetical protein